MVFADDMLEVAPTTVVLKLMTDQNAFERELSHLNRNTHEQVPTAIHLIRSHAHIESDFSSPRTLAGCLVLSKGDRTLADAMLHDNFVGQNTVSMHVRGIMIQLGNGLSYLHSRNIVHCDFKPLNVMQFGSQWKLIDFDAAAWIGHPIGHKSSACVAPPEMFVLDKMGNVVQRGVSSTEALLASPAYDSWSFGAVLYQMLTGHTLFTTDHGDHLTVEGQHALSTWSTTECERRLLSIDTSTLRNSQGCALLRKLLAPCDESRPNLRHLRMHSFFQDDPHTRFSSLPCSHPHVPSPCAHAHADSTNNAKLYLVCSENDVRWTNTFLQHLSAWCPVVSASIDLEIISESCSDLVDVLDVPRSVTGEMKRYRSGELHHSAAPAFQTDGASACKPRFFFDRLIITVVVMITGIRDQEMTEMFGSVADPNCLSLHGMMNTPQQQLWSFASTSLADLAQHSHFSTHTAVGTSAAPGPSLLPGIRSQAVNAGVLTCPSAVTLAQLFVSPVLLLHSVWLLRRSFLK